MDRADIRTKREVLLEPGISENNEGIINLHFSPIPNWYGCITGFDCPFCDNSITWEWGDNLPNITTGDTTKHLTPKVSGGELMTHGHRFIHIKCDVCDNELFAENFDR